MNDFENYEGEIFARAGEVTPIPWSCAACGEENETLLDLSGGFYQEYTEDCAVCCRPNLLMLTVDETTMAVTMSNELEYE